MCVHVYIHVYVTCQHKKGPCAEIINHSKMQIFTSLQIFVNFHFFMLLQYTKNTVHDDTFTLARSALFCEIWPQQLRQISLFMHGDR